MITKASFEKKDKIYPDGSPTGEYYHEVDLGSYIIVIQFFSIFRAVVTVFQGGLGGQFMKLSEEVVTDKSQVQWDECVKMANKINDEFIVLQEEEEQERLAEIAAANK